MSDSQDEELRVGFDSRLKLKFLGSQITTGDRAVSQVRHPEFFRGDAAFAIPTEKVCAEPEIDAGKRSGWHPGLIFGRVRSRKTGQKSPSD